jgi:hypothetical protein
MVYRFGLGVVVKKILLDTAGHRTTATKPEPLTSCYNECAEITVGKPCVLQIEFNWLSSFLSRAALVLSSSVHDVSARAPQNVQKLPHPHMNYAWGVLKLSKNVFRICRIQATCNISIHSRHVLAVHRKFVYSKWGLWNIYAVRVQWMSFYGRLLVCAEACISDVLFLLLATSQMNYKYTRSLKCFFVHWSVFFLNLL